MDFMIQAGQVLCYLKAPRARRRPKYAKTYQRLPREAGKVQEGKLKSGSSTTLIVILDPGVLDLTVYSTFVAFPIKDKRSQITPDILVLIRY